MKMNLKKIAAGAAMAGIAGLGALGFGTGVAQARPHDGCYGQWGNCWVPGDPPGQNGFGPPGQVMNGNPYVYGLTGVPPGHWGDPGYYGLPTTYWPPGAPWAQNVVWNNDVAQWGAWWANQFFPLPPQ